MASVGAGSWVHETPLVPPQPLPLGGYTARGDHRFLPGGQSLFARAVALEGEHRPVVLMAFEALTIPEFLRRSVAAKMETDADLVVWATHTHCAPDSQMLNDRMTLRIPGIAIYNRSVAEWYAGRLAELADRAARNPVSATRMSYAEAPAAGLNRLRRPTGRPYDTLAILRADHQPLLLVNPAHPTILGDEFRHTQGDWPGWLMRHGVALAATGPIGDASPAVEGSSVENVAEYGRRVLETGSNEPAQRVWKTLGKAECRFVPIYLPPAQPHPEFAEAYDVVPALAQLAVGRFAPPEAFLTIVRVGPVRIIGVPGEPTGDLARRMIAQAGEGPVIVMSHVNGWGGYMLTPQEYDEGGYEATLSFYGRDLETALLDAVQRGLAEPTR